MRRKLGEEKQAAMISKFALILLIFNNILIQSTCISNFLNSHKLTGKCKIINSFGRMQGGANVNFVR